MLDSMDDFKYLMRRLGEGDVTAAEQVVDRYGTHITRAIRRRFRSRKMKVLYGTEDCMQSVWGAIFSDVDRVAKIETPTGLMKYLAKVAGNKLIDQDRHLRAQRNDIYRECNLPEPDGPDEGALATGDLTPSQAVAIDDEWKVHTDGLSTENRTILELHRLGHTSEEIARQTATSARRIRQVIQQYRERLRKNFGFEPEPPELRQQTQDNQASQSNDDESLDGDSDE